MVGYKIINIEYVHSGEIGVFSIDLPKAGESNGVIEFAGWYKAARGNKAASVEICLNRQVLTRARLNIERPDVSDYDKQCGFHVITSFGILPKKFTLNIFINLVDKDDREKRVKRLVAILTGVCSVNIESHTNKRNPILVTGMGRSGTTLLMDILLSSQSISGDHCYPFETRPAAYHMHNYQLMTGISDYEYSLSPDGFELNLLQTGRNPYFHRYFLLRENMKNTSIYLNEKYQAKLASQCIEIIDQIYDSIDQDYKKHHTRFFAEKYLPSNIQQYFYSLYDNPKEIFIVRDFRDLIASAANFNKNRGRIAFGRDKVGSDREWVERMRLQGIESLLNSYKERKDRALLIKYEDLVDDRGSQIEKIFEYLGLESDEVEIVKKNIFEKDKDKNQHITSDSAKESVGRWKKDLSDDFKHYCKEYFTDALVEFGYEV